MTPHLRVVPAKDSAAPPRSCWVCGQRQPEYVVRGGPYHSWLFLCRSCAQWLSKGLREAIAAEEVDA